LVSNQEQAVIVGGDVHQEFIPDSNINVIQAAAPDGISGDVQLSSPIQDISGSLIKVNTEFNAAQSIAQNPCNIKSGKIPSSLYETGNGAAPVDVRQLTDLPVDVQIPVGCQKFN